MKVKGNPPAYLFLYLVTIMVIMISCSNEKDNTNAGKLGFPAGTKVLLMHCDDAGMCEEANIAVSNYFITGDIRSAAVMIPCPYAEAMVQWAKTQGSPDLGVHLTLTSEWKTWRWGTVADSVNVPGLIDPEGKMWHDVPDVLMHATAE